MVFRDFDRARGEATQEVNTFLERTWGIKDYTVLAPVVLLVREPGHKVFTAFPLTLLESPNDEGWTATVFREKFDEIQISGGNARGELELWISEGKLSGLDWESAIRKGEGQEGRVVFVSSDGISGRDAHEDGFDDFVRESFPLGKYVSLQSFGMLIEPHSGMRRNFYVADALSSGKFGKDHQLRLGQWLKARVEDGTAVPFSRQELVSADQEDSGAEPVGQQEPDDIPF